MKALVCALMLASDAHACAVRVADSFARIKPGAVAMVPEMDMVTWKFAWFMPSSTVASVHRGSMLISINELLMCSKPDFEIDAIIAHEFGHMISRRDARHHRLTEAGHEDVANYYGAQLIPDSTMYLRLVDGRCSMGSVYNCETAVSWRKGVYGT